MAKHPGTVENFKYDAAKLETARLNYSTYEGLVRDAEQLGLKTITTDMVKIGEVYPLLLSEEGRQVVGGDVIWVQVVGFFKDNMKLSGDLYAWECHDFFAPAVLLGNGCQHDPVNTGLLKSWCKKCNSDMVFNRATGEYE